MSSMPSGHNVLVVGGAGFIGVHAIAHLVKLGYAVYATCLPGQELPEGIQADWIACDLTADDFTRTWPDNCSSIIYLAQSPRWREFPAGAVDVFRVNVAGAFQAVEYARRIGAERFLFTSSGSVYGQVERPAFEGDLIGVGVQRRFYDACKISAELMLQAYRGLLSIVILRLFAPYGTGQSREMLIPQLVEKVREGRPILLHGSDGLQTNPVAAADVAETLARCLTLKKTGVFNVAGPETLTLREMGNQIGEILKIRPHFQSDLPGPRPVIVGDTRNLREVLGWAPETRFSSGLRTWLNPDSGVEIAYGTVDER